TPKEAARLGLLVFVVDAEQARPAAFFQGIEHRVLLRARRTPRGPKIDDADATGGELGRGEAADGAMTVAQTIERGKADGGRALANQRAGQLCRSARGPSKAAHTRQRRT